MRINKEPNRRDMPPNRVSRVPTAIERAVVGVVVCCLAAIPLAIGYSIHGFYTSDDPWSAAYVVVGTGVVVSIGCLIAGVCATCFGVPIYVLSARLKVLRPLVLLVGASIAGVVVHEMWHGGSLFEDPEGARLFAFFGLYSGVAFWLGADVLAVGGTRSGRP